MELLRHLEVIKFVYIILSMITRAIRKQLNDKYHYSGFYPNRYLEVAKWDSDARIIRLTRRSKNYMRSLRESSSGLV